MTCAKTRVTCTLIHPSGAQWVGENWCHNPQTACPRVGNEGYEKCKTICDQNNGHAELDALRRAGTSAAGCRAELRGHTYACQSCQEALFAAGVISLRVMRPGQ